MSQHSFDFVTGEFLSPGEAVSNGSKGGPAWDNSAEYTSISSREFEADVASAERNVAQIEKLSSNVTKFLLQAETLNAVEAKEAIDVCAQVFALREATTKLLYNASTFAQCELSVDGKNAEARAAQGVIQSLGSRFSQALTPVQLFLTRVSDDVLNAFLKKPQMGSEEFLLKHSRKRRDFLLSLEEENLITAMEVNGITAWGNLYNTVSSNLVCEVELPTGTKKVGIAEASGMLRSGDEEERKAAFHARKVAWEGQEDVCAAALNAIAGWRLDEYERRSKNREFHFLDEPLQDNRIERRTLDAMMGAAEDFSPQVIHSLKLAAGMLGKSQLDGWDLMAPAPQIGKPSEKKISFEDAVSHVERAFSQVNPEMGAFVRMMYDKKWIEARVLPTKRHGAYCTWFKKSRTPRVYMTYLGSNGDVQTLAHELGHAFHFWVMRDLPSAQISLPMTLAETASVFGETVSCELLSNNAKNIAEEFEAAWIEAQSAAVFISNIPSRYEFEKSFYEQRKNKVLSANELSELMATYSKKHYREAVVGSDKSLNWASTLHYFITGLSFYNFPYTFGYLFSLGVYAQWKKRGADFYKSYVSLLEDTGRMTAEDLVQKHFGLDIRKKEFWNESLAIVGQKLHRFEEICQRILSEDDRR